MNPATPERRSVDLKRLSKDQLISRLMQLEDKEFSSLTTEAIDEYDQAFHELQVHQIELEMQNRELRESQHMLEQSRSRYLALYDFSPTGFCTLDPSGIVLEANATAATMLGSPRECLRGQPFGSLVVAEHQAVFRQRMRECLQSQARPDFQVLVKVGAGNQAHPLQILMRCLPSVDAASPSVYMALVDAQARSAFANKLNFLSQTSDILAQSLDIPAICKSIATLAVPMLGQAAHLSVFANDSQETLLPFEGPVYADEQRRAALEPYFAATGLDDLSSMQQMAKDERRIVALKSMTGPRAAAYIKNKAAQRVLFDAHVRSIVTVPLLARNKVLAVLTVIRTRSESTSTETFEEDLLTDYARRAAMAMDNAHLYALAQRKTDARSKLLAMVSHDLRSPLSAIVLKAQMLDRKADRGDVAYIRRCAETVLAAASRMDGLIGDLLDIASMDSGQFSVRRSPTELLPMLQDACEAGTQLAQKKQIHVALTPPSADVHIDCDRPRILQVMGNLMGNAIKFTEPGGHITISANSDGERTCVGVADDGPGMNAATLARIFEGFWQADETAHLGKGLGLAICKGIVEANGGSLWARSTPGQGSAFYFTLQHPEPTMTTTSAAKPSARRRRRPAKAPSSVQPVSHA